MKTEFELENELRDMTIRTLQKYLVVLKAKRNIIIDSDIFLDKDDFDPAYLSQLIEYYEIRLEQLRTASIDELEQSSRINHSRLVKERISESNSGDVVQKLDDMIMGGDRSEVLAIYIREQSDIADKMITEEVLSVFGETLVPTADINGISGLPDEALSGVVMNAIKKGTSNSLEPLQNVKVLPSTRFYLKTKKPLLYNTYCKIQTISQIKDVIKNQKSEEAGME